MPIDSLCAEPHGFGAVIHNNQIIGVVMREGDTPLPAVATVIERIMGPATSTIMAGPDNYPRVSFWRFATPTPRYDQRWQYLRESISLVIWEKDEVDFEFSVWTPDAELNMKLAAAEGHALDLDDDWHRKLLGWYEDRLREQHERQAAPDRVETDETEDAPSGGFTMLPNDDWNLDLSMGAKITYFALRKHCWGRRTYCIVGLERLAGHVGAGVRSMDRYLDELETTGLITITRRGRKKANRYDLLQKSKREK